MRVIILVLLLVTKQLRASQASSLTSVVKFEQCDTNNLGHVFLQGKDVSLRKCAAHCSKKECCKGLSFGKNLMLCGLYNDMTLWEKRQSIQGDCAVIYKENLTGMNFADVELEKLKECDEFVTVANGTVPGNMNREGNRKQKFCKSVDAELMTITTDDDKAFVLFTYVPVTVFITWTGLQMEHGQLKNMYTGEIVTVTNWCSAGNNIDVESTCVTLAVHTNNAPCMLKMRCGTSFMPVCKHSFGT